MKQTAQQIQALIDKAKDRIRIEQMGIDSLERQLKEIKVEEYLNNRKPEIHPSQQQ